MTIKHWLKPDDQICQLGKHRWSVPRLFELSKDLEVMEIPLNHINMYYTYEKLSLREVAGHIAAANNANLDFPIILDEDGEIMDGRHRLIKCIVEGIETIKAKRFKENPSPCTVDEG